MVRRVRALVELLERVQEARADAVLLVERDGFLERRLGDEVAVRKNLGEDARARLLFLGQGGAAVGGAVDGLGGRVGGGGAGDADLVAAERRVVEEEGGARGRLLFEGYGGVLVVARGGDLKGRDLAAAEWWVSCELQMLSS